jgi:hypothetical protein
MDPTFGREGKVFSRFSDIAGPELKPVSICGDNHREMGGVRWTPFVRQPEPLLKV